jgi:hypothetical protein
MDLKGAPSKLCLGGVLDSPSSQTSVTAITDIQPAVGDNGIDLWCVGGGVIPRADPKRRPSNETPSGR